MPWRPPRGQVPAHDLDRYSYRVAVLMSLGGSLAGHLLVLPSTYWQRSAGHLWWRQWHKPTVAAEVLVTLPGQDPDWTEGFYWDEGLEDVLHAWDTGMIVEEAAQYGLTWLDLDASRQVAESAFDVDLEQERLKRA